MNYRPISDHDIVNYLQDNQALLKTILWRLEQMSEKPTQTQLDDLNKYREYLDEIKVVFEVASQLPTSKI